MKEYADNSSARSSRRSYRKQLQNEQGDRVRQMVSMVLALGSLEAATEWVNDNYRVRELVPTPPYQKTGRKPKL